MAEIVDSPKRDAFAGWPMVVLWAGMLVFAGHACTHMVAAGDTWVAMACGRHFVNHGVDTVEPFSANSHKAGPTEAELEKHPAWLRPVVKKLMPTGWVNQNWLTHVIFYQLAKTFGSKGEYNYDMLIYWKFAVTILSAVFIYYYSRVMGAERLLSAAAAAFAVFVGRTFIDVRPAVFSNVMIPLYLLMLALAVHRNIRYIYLLIPVVVFWCNVHGGYIYAFIMFVPFVGLNFLTIPSKKIFVSTGMKGFLHSAAAGIAALIAMIIFNPFHLTNLTHTFEVSLSKHAEGWRMVREWKPAFDWMDKTTDEVNPVGNEEAFAVMCIIAFVALMVWGIARFLEPRISTKRRARKKAELCPNQYSWPKIDLALITIAALTVYMAIKSRRFIPIASAAACPIIAMLITQAIEMISARIQYNKDQRLVAAQMTKHVRTVLLAGVCIVVVAFGGFWGAKYKRIYLDPWPNDDIRDSVFMRMTASNLKPFDACRFIRENKLSGNMFNYWTEGGAIAFGQEPGPDGKTPLKLFMDGRAQAAYNYDAFQRWSYINSGGPTAMNARIGQRKITKKEFDEIGDYIDREMKNRKVWVILLPTSQFDSNFMNGLQTRGNWATAYIDNHQRLFVDTETEKGKELIDNVINGKAKFPNDFSMYMTLSRNIPVEQGYQCAVKALELQPSQGPMIMIMAVAKRYPPLRTQANEYIKKYLDEFNENKDTYVKEAGYLNKLTAASVGARHMRSEVKDKKMRDGYANIHSRYTREIRRISLNARW